MEFNRSAMKQGIVILAVVLTGSVCQAQTFDEWFKQKETQKKYLIQQIAALKVYTGYVQKGYDIAQKGLTTISNVKSGDFNLHKGFLGSLKNINPTVSRSAKAADIISLQVRTLKVYKGAHKRIRGSGAFNSEEVNYIFSVFTSLLADCHTVLAELNEVITSGKLEMRDDERLVRIDNLYTRMQENYVIAQSFSGEAKLLLIQREGKKAEIQKSQLLIVIKK